MSATSITTLPSKTIPTFVALSWGLSGLMLKIDCCLPVDGHLTHILTQKEYGQEIIKPLVKCHNINCTESYYEGILKCIKSTLSKANHCTRSKRCWLASWLYKGYKVRLVTCQDRQTYSSPLSEVNAHTDGDIWSSTPKKWSQRIFPTTLWNLNQIWNKAKSNTH